MTPLRALSGRIPRWRRDDEKEAGPEEDEERPSLALHQGVGGENLPAAGRVVDLTEMDSPRPDNGRTAAIAPPNGPIYPREEDEASMGVVAAQRPKVA